MVVWGDWGTRKVPGERGVMESGVSMEGTGGCVEDLDLEGSLRGGCGRLSLPGGCWPDMVEPHYWVASHEVCGRQNRGKETV